MKWISVKDQLPPLEARVLMIDEEMGNDIPTVGWYEKLDDPDGPVGFFTADHCLRMRLVVTHWLAIPAFDK